MFGPSADEWPVFESVSLGVGFTPFLHTIEPEPTKIDREKLEAFYKEHPYFRPGYKPPESELPDHPPDLVDATSD